MCCFITVLQPEAKWPLVRGPWAGLMGTGVVVTASVAGKQLTPSSSHHRSPQALTRLSL